MNNNFITGVLTILIIGILSCIVVLGIDAFNSLSPLKNEVATQQDITEQYIIIEKKEDLSIPQIVETQVDTIDEIGSEEVNYNSSSSKTRFFYNQLNSYSQIIYDGIASNIEKMKNGTYTVQYGDKFSNILSKENGQTELGNYYQSAIEAFTYDNPTVFFLDPTKMYLNIQTTTRGNQKTYNVYITCAEGTTYLTKGFDSVEQINQCQAQIEQVKNYVLNSIESNSTEKKIKYIHDYLIDSLTYDQTLSKDNIYNLYGALINKECVCEGYAKAFKYLLDEAGVDNVIVVGTGTNSKGETENHAWNYVAIDGSWYAVDVTWDDPIIQGFTFTTGYKSKYYLKGSKEISIDHIASGQFSNDGKVFSYPELSDTDY